MSADNGPAARARILVVDDNPSVLLALEYFLPTVGYAVITAPDGRTGMELAAGGDVALVLLDVDMPVMNGHAVCEALQANAELRRIPIVMMTGRPSRDVVARGLAAGARAVIGKPFDLDVLQAELAHHIASGLSGANAR
jgi:DNA-binding response OmpR family regulator